jgi:thiol:disulfide interchange protein DsbD
MRNYGFASRIVSFLSIAMTGMTIGGALAAEPVSKVSTDQAEVELISEKEATSAGATQWIGILFKPKAGWHVYWKNPGDSGLPPRVELASNPDGSTFGPLQFPVPDRIPYGPLVNFAYEGNALYPSKWTAPASLVSGESVTITANVKWLICKEECVPGKAQLALRLPVEDAARLESIVGTHAALFRSAIGSLPREETGKVRVALVDEGEKDRLEIFYSGTAPKSKRSVYFFPEGEYGISADAKATIATSAEGLRVSIPRKEKKAVGEIRGVLKLGEGKGVLVSEVIDPKLLARETAAPVAPSPQQSLGWMVLFAFIGGLILNLMPCILPVLSIKVMELANQAGSRNREIRAHGLVYTLGILVSFWILAAIFLSLRAGGATLGWGFQLQSPVFVAALGVLFFLMGMNLFGFFEIGGRLMGVGGALATRGGYYGSFFTGVLTTLAATPCSAPFMGTALGFALSQPASVAITVLTALALGLAFPYLLFSFLPAAARILPRPGAWMKTMKEGLAFPLFATVAWLLSVLGNQAGVEAVFRTLFALILVTAAIWFTNWQTQRRVPKIVSRILAIISIILAIGLVQGLGTLRKKQLAENASESALVHEPWRAWSPELLENSLAEKKTVIVNLTADWCVTCKVNETVVFEREIVKEALRGDRIVALVGDWTNGDPRITEYMMKNGRNSVPVYLLYKNGSRQPKILPQILSVEGFLKELH